MQKALLLPVFLLFTIFSIPQMAFAQCPGCAVNVPSGLGEDTIYLAAVPDAQTGLSYDEDVSFRLPKTTTPVNANDPSIPAGLGINEIVISSLINLPPGLSWQANKDSYTPADETDGCIKLCGKPLVSGWYTIEVKLSATVIVVTQETSIFIEMYVAPPVSANDGFTMTNFEGCGSVEVSFINNIPSNGLSGYSYQWDFGNGNTSLDENPSNQIYDQVGSYPINYTATIDTTGYFLTNVTVEESECNDWPNQAPDILINIFTSNGTLIYQSEKQKNTWPPVSFPLNIKLDENTAYILEAIDKDSGINGADDQCVYHNFNILSDGVVVGPGWKVTMDIFHPVSTVNFADTVVVHPMPDAPIIVPTATEACPGVHVVLASSITENIQWYKDGEIIEGETGQGLNVEESGSYQVVVTNEFACSAWSEPIEFIRFEAPEAPDLNTDINEFCEGEEAILSSSYDDNNQWYLDGTALPDGVESTYVAITSGVYTVEYTSDDGCTATSPELILTVYPNPDEPLFENLNNVLTLLPTVLIPDNHSLLWSYNGNVLEGEISNELCTNTPGTYSVLLTDEDTGCSSLYSREVSIDPDHNCIISSLQDLAISEVQLFPNPVQDRLQLSMQFEKAERVTLRLVDAGGRYLQSWNLDRQSGELHYEMDLSRYSAGFYFLQIQTAHGVGHYKLVKQ